MIKSPSILLLLALLLTCGVAAAEDFHLPDNCRQTILCLAPDWQSSAGTFSLWSRSEGGTWRRETLDIPMRLGEKGLAWGRGLSPEPPLELQKKEGDWKAPAGVFEIGAAFGYAKDFPVKKGQSYIQVKPGELWIADPTSSYYNQHLSLHGREPETDWEKRGQMRLGDPSHSLKLFIAHNAPPNVRPGAGSAIFFHIWREKGAIPSSGCIVSERSAIEHLVEWVDPSKHPLCVILPMPEYKKLKIPWQLP